MIDGSLQALLPHFLSTNACRHFARRPGRHFCFELVSFLFPCSRLSQTIARSTSSASQSRPVLFTAQVLAVQQQLSSTYAKKHQSLHRSNKNTQKKSQNKKSKKKKTRTRSSALRVCCPKSGGSTSPHRPNIVPKHLRLRVYTELSISVYCFSRDLPRVTIIIVLKYSRSVAILSFRTRFVPSPSTQRSTLTTVRPTTRPS